MVLACEVYCNEPRRLVAVENMLNPVKNWLRKWLEEPPAAQPVTKPLLHSRSPALPMEPRPAVSAIVDPARTNGKSGAKADVLELPLATIFSVLPNDLQARARLPLDGGALVPLPFGLVFPQLGRGAVKITFGELRQMAPPETFYSQTDRDQAVVELPLGEILARLKPAMLPRREQKPVEIPTEIVSPFADKGQGLHIYKPESAPVKSSRRPEPDQDLFSAAPEFPARGHITSVPPSPQISCPPIAATAPMAMPVGLPRNPVTPSSTNTFVQAAAQPANGDGAVLSVALKELAENWPDAIRAEIAPLQLNAAIVNLPLAVIKDAMKKGRAMFTWKQIRQWTNSAAAGQAHSAHDSELLELPLKVVTPLFLSRLNVTKPAPKIAVDKSIPDLFSKSARPELAPFNGKSESTPVKTPAPNKETVVFSDIADYAGKGRVAGDDVRSGTDFLKRYATPNDIVGKAASLEGVVGALITLPDGLLVASHLPADMNGDALAAFTPQIYARVSQSAREYRMGELKDLTFTVGSTPWKIFKVGSIFLAAFGKLDEPLPVKELAALAAELDRKPKNQ